MERHLSLTFSRVATAAAAAVAIALVSLAARAPAAAQTQPQEIKVGIVAFLSGAAASPFGIPARNGAEILLEGLDKGSVPAPYEKKGFGGIKIVPVYMDEAAGPDPITAYRRLASSVDFVIGYISSEHCLSIAPAAEQQQKLTVFFDCGTPRIFEDNSYNYVFRTTATAAVDNIAAARYVFSLYPNIKTVSGINQNYAWGQDSWKEFSAAITSLDSKVKIGSAQFPAIFAGSYSSQISALLSADPDVIHSSFWGGDAEGLLIQGAPLGLFTRSHVVLTAGEPILHRQGIASLMPSGVVLGARGPHGPLAPESKLDDWFSRTYEDRYNNTPAYPSYHMAQAILGLKAAFEKAQTVNHTEHPTNAQIISAFEHLSFTTPSGTITMALGKGHQAVEPAAYGVTKVENGKVTLVDVKHYPVECVNPPAGMKADQWIAQHFPGAKNCPK
ncbi:ABC transporter substrate-binding protein [bacterium]|nr:MAG: ABC transporter substrate-binding protein [bacterium]